jgi:ribosomal protein S9
MGEILVSWRLALSALVLALTTTLLASVYPAWNASRLVIVDALRHNHLLTRDSRMKERKHYGLRGARKGTQFSKR